MARSWAKVKAEMERTIFAGQLNILDDTAPSTDVQTARPAPAPTDNSEETGASSCSGQESLFDDPSLDISDRWYPR